jgi:hypothetical protein
MGNTRKGFFLLLVVVLAVSSLIMVESTFAFAQSIPKPSVPEFTLKYVEQSYYKQPTYTIDPYTGKQIVENEGGYINKNSIEIKIKNQPFNSYKDASGNYTALYYNVRYKGHYEDQWRTYPLSSASGYWEASKSDYTLVSFPHTQLGRFTPGGTMDFQVQALFGYQTVTMALIPPVTDDASLTALYQFHGTEGSWSNSQSIKIPEPSTSPNPTPTPTVPELSSLAILPLIVLMFFIAVILRHRKPISQNKPNVLWKKA